MGLGEIFDGSLLAVVYLRPHGQQQGEMEVFDSPTKEKQRQLTGYLLISKDFV